MVVGFAFVAYALLEGFDQRIVKFSPEKERCAALSLCRACIKYSDAPCGLKRLFTIMTPALAVLALMPFSVDLNTDAYQTEILGKMHHYFHPVSAQLLELRYCPALALLLFTASWLVLLFKRNRPVALAKPLFAGAAGALSFGLLRMFFTLTFRDDLMWFDVWEEVTELLFILGTAAVLWVFRTSLFPSKHPAMPNGGSVAEATA
jgi:hypothetical protein